MPVFSRRAIGRSVGADEWLFAPVSVLAAEARGALSRVRAELGMGVAILLVSERFP